MTRLSLGVENFDDDVLEENGRAHRSPEIFKAYDWAREIDTTSPDYVKWTQWIFLKLFKRGLAYQSEVAVNWCAELGTVLANEEVINGLSERGGHPVERVPLRQWVLKITEYADRLLDRNLNRDRR